MRPWLGTTMSLRAASLPGGPAALALGISRTSWGAIALPLDMTPFGAPGCSLQASADLVAGLTGGGATRSLPLGIPLQPVLLGREFYAQAFVADPLANALGIVVSNGGRLLVGGR
jgi:hypothetical protein